MSFNTIYFLSLNVILFISDKASTNTHSSHIIQSSTTPDPKFDEELERVNAAAHKSLQEAMAKAYPSEAVQKEEEAERKRQMDTPPASLFQPLNVPKEDTRTCYNTNFNLFGLCSIICAGAGENVLITTEAGVLACNATTVSVRDDNGGIRIWKTQDPMGETMWRFHEKRNITL
jgi:hypothetical protein